MVFCFLFILIIPILYLMAIMPKITNMADFTPFKGWFYAHRGLYQDEDTIPENSMAAFKLAIENNYGIEFDIQLSKDDIPVVFHDDNLERVCGVDGYIWEYTYEELKEFRLFGSSEGIPLLTEVLELVDGKVPLIIELKGDKKDTSIAGIVAPFLDNYQGIYCIESFNPMIILWFKKNRPNIIRGQLSMRYEYEDKSPSEKFLYFGLQNLLLNFLTKPDFIAYNHKDTDVFSFKLSTKLYNPFLFAYTIQSTEDLQKNWDKFDLFIFDKFVPNQSPK